jgi:predicted transcriptional regulator
MGEYGGRAVAGEDLETGIYAFVWGAGVELGENDEGAPAGAGHTTTSRAKISRKMISGYDLTNELVYLTYENNRKMGKQLKPTESELEILQVLWEKQKATVREVHETLAQSKDVGYTTTLKLMQIMYEKGLVRRDESSKTHIYEPLASREKTQKQLVSRMVDTLFQGSPAQLVMQALGQHKTSAGELEEIQRLLDNLKNQ